MSTAVEQTFHTPAETAELLKVAERTLADWRLKRIGPRSHKFGGRVRYSRTDIDAFIKASRT